MRIILLAAALALTACNQGSGVESAMRDEQREQSRADAVCAEAGDDRPDVQTTAGGVRVEITRRTAAPCLPAPAADSIVLVHYEGSLTNGTVFDSSYQRGEPAPFPVNAVIPGWTEALMLLKPGDEAQLLIPAALGYGRQGAPPDIPPNADLRFRVELLGVASGDGSEVHMAPGFSLDGAQ